MIYGNRIIHKKIHFLLLFDFVGIIDRNKRIILAVEQIRSKTENLRYLPHLIFIVFLLLICWSVFNWSLETKEFNNTHDVILQIEIFDDDAFSIENKIYSKDELSQHLSQRVNDFKNKGTSMEQIICVISAKNNVTLGPVSDVQNELRYHGIRKISFR